MSSINISQLNPIAHLSCSQKIEKNEKMRGGNINFVYIPLKFGQTINSINGRYGVREYIGIDSTGDISNNNEKVHLRGGSIGESYYCSWNRSTNTGVDFQNVNMSGSTFEKVHFHRCRMGSCNLSNSTFTECTFEMGQCHSSDWPPKFNSSKFIRTIFKTGIPINADGSIFEHCNLSGLKITPSRAKFDNCNMSNATLEANNCHFTNCDISGLTFGAPAQEFTLDECFHKPEQPPQSINSNLTKCRINKSTLRKVNFDRGNWEGVVFKDGKLLKCIFKGTLTNKCEFDNMDLTGTKFEGVGKIGSNVFLKSNLSDVIFKCDLKGFKITNCFHDTGKPPKLSKESIKNKDGDYTDWGFYFFELGDLHFKEAKFNEARFINTKLERCEFLGVKAIDSDWDFSQISSCDFSGSTANKAKFNNTVIKSTAFINNILREASFRKAKLDNVHFDGADLSEAVFADGELTHSFLRGECNLHKTVFENMDLSGTDFRGAKNLKTAIFRNCSYQEGYPPIFDHDLSPETLDITRVKNPALHHPLPKLDPDNQFFSPVSHRELPSLPGAAQQLMVSLAQQKPLPGTLQESETLAPLLQGIRKEFEQPPEEENLNLYTPEARDPRQDGESGSISLHLDRYVLRDAKGKELLDLRGIKDACFAQQLYSAYTTMGTDALTKAYWMRRLQEAYGRDFNLNTRGRDHGWHVPSGLEQSFIKWMKEKYKLYEDKFNLEKTLLRLVPENEGFNAIVGYGDVKNQLIQQVIAPLIYPAINPMCDTKPAKGLIFHGPPGTGKSFTARQLIQHLGLKPLEVHLGTIGSGFQHMPIRNLREKFVTADRLARRHGASGMRLDEIDSVGSEQHGNQANLPEALQTNLTDFVEEGDSNMLTIGTTNHLTRLKDAVTRAGRLGEHIEISLPDEETRRAYLEKAIPEASPFLGQNPYEGGRESIITHAVNATRNLSMTALVAFVKKIMGGYNQSVTHARIDSTLQVIREQQRLNKGQSGH